jgi:hypothetical protein
MLRTVLGSILGGVLESVLGGKLESVLRGVLESVLGGVLGRGFREYWGAPGERIWERKSGRLGVCNRAQSGVYC